VNTAGDDSLGLYGLLCGSQAYQVTPHRAGDTRILTPSTAQPPQIDYDPPTMKICRNSLRQMCLIVRAHYQCSYY